MTTNLSTEFFYDVCNDYSLEAREKPNDLNKYVERERVINGCPVTLYFHRRHDELHYLKSDSKVNFKYTHHRNTSKQ